MTSNFKSGTVAIIGRPNVGKSTLLNLLVEFKLAAISPKPQTTRHKILGIITGDGYQIGFLDTPGIPAKTGDEMDRYLVARAMEAIKEADLAVLMVEPKPPGDIEKKLIQELKRGNKQSILVINKIDLIKETELLPLIKEYSLLYAFLEIIPVSVLKMNGMDSLKAAIIWNLPENIPVFLSDELTDRPERFFVAEMIREQIFNAFNQEVPYAVAVEVDEFRERAEEQEGKDYIKAILYVEKDSQKAILIGRRGEKLKEIGQKARQEIETLLGRPVYLELWVKVHPKWRKDKAFLKRIGY